MFTQNEINQFHKNGIIIAKGLIRGDELLKLQNATAKVVSEGMANSPQQTDIDGPSDYLGNNKFDDHIYLVKEDVSYHQCLFTQKTFDYTTLCTGQRKWFL